MTWYYVYIMASHRRVLYIGVTSKLEKRVWQHKSNVFEASFTSRYRCRRLVYFERYADIRTAIGREKGLKHFTRAEKIALIEKENPKWRDLSSDWKRPSQILPPPFGRRKDDIPGGVGFLLERGKRRDVVRLNSRGGMNRLKLVTVVSLTNTLQTLLRDAKPLIITGNKRFFSTGADLNEIARLTGPEALRFAEAGQRLMQVVDDYPALVVAAIEGYCMGGGLDLALACDRRVASPGAVFGHRGAALGIMTGWGGTQRLPRLIGKGRALQMFMAAEKLTAQEALAIGLIDEIAEDPVAAAYRLCESTRSAALPPD